MDTSGADHQDREKLKSKHGKQPFRTLVTLSGKGKKKTKKKERTNNIKKKGRTSSTPSSSDKAVSMTKHKLEKHYTECTEKTSSPSGRSSRIALNGSLRWKGALDDPFAEEERIRQCKINRRKRYLLAAQQSTCNKSNSQDGFHDDMKLYNSGSVAKRDYSDSSFIGQSGQPKQLSALPFPAHVNMFKNHL
ncbi:hypothetical protein XELAEV_18015347mg [Xenopus laevis]|uniref:Uncharacterized protein n=1 Tax=Xenopus laevis TaxID=8355 RepID=A0A974DJM6_XENLA|nr:hypothetical protein XELAEV_18015347mg [Xenopus laevis]